MSLFDMQVSFPGWTHLYGFNISISTAHLPATIQMVMYYNIGQCNGTKIDNSTLRKVRYLNIKL